MAEKIKSFRDLEVWKKGIEILKKIYITSGLLPQHEKYGLISQMQRCSVSIPANVAEGFNRFHNKEYRQFLYVSLGSCAELETLIEISSELKHINEQKKADLLEIINHESRMLRSLIKKVDKVV